MGLAGSAGKFYIDMDNIKSLLTEYAQTYETVAFLDADPSLFMHRVSGRLNQETMAFIASSVSYGSRKQFMPKIQHILDLSEGAVYEWVRSGRFDKDIPCSDTCFYRLYTMRTMNSFLHALKSMLDEYGSIGEFVKSEADDGFSAVKAICGFFADRGITGIIPKDTTSACKRVCMFLRWMVRDNSPVDLGLWSGFIDKRTLIIPMDTHVMQEARALGLLSGSSASMASARKLTKALTDVFPDDPLKGDFALFGFGVNK